MCNTEVSFFGSDSSNKHSEMLCRKPKLDPHLKGGARCKVCAWTSHFKGSSLIFSPICRWRGFGVPEVNSFAAKPNRMLWYSQPILHKPQHLNSTQILITVVQFELLPVPESHSCKLSWVRVIHH